jgi:hypothetical protein
LYFIIITIILGILSSTQAVAYALEYYNPLFPPPQLSTASSLTPQEKLLEFFLGDEPYSEQHSRFLTAQILDGE